MDDELPLARLLSAATRLVIEDLNERLAARGHPDLRPAHGYAVNAIAAGATTTARLAGELEMTKQGAAKLVAALERLGYLRLASDPDDARARALHLTPKARALLHAASEVQDEIESEWRELAGERPVRALRSSLERLVRERGDEERPRLRPIW